VRVLIAEDDPVSRHLLRTTLTSAGYEPVIAVDGAEALRALDQPDCPRLIVLDWIMPHLDGIEICRIIRKRSQEPYFYVILLTVKGEQQEIVEGLEAGADDYVTKPFDLHELKARLRAGKRIIELQQQLIASRDQLQFEATHDSHTGLLNHAAILETLRLEVLRSTREGTPLGVIMADLDHFKSVNDHHGHLVGDGVLREVAARLKNSLRPYDSIGRYGGEEFLVIVPGCTQEKAAALAERLRQCVASGPIRPHGVEISITASFGAASAIDATVPDLILRAADEALYRAKIEGRNRVVASSPAELPLTPAPAVM
jgi:two-component system cell cycle response regulator